MKFFKFNAWFIILALLSFSAIAATDTVSITPINGLPAIIVQNTVITGLTYNIHNNSASGTYEIGFTNLDKNGMTHTTTCGSLVPNGDCLLTIALNVPALPPSLYSNQFNITGAPTATLVNLTSTIVAGESTVTPNLVVKLNNPGVTVSGTPFEVHLHLQGGATYDYPNLALGTTPVSAPIPQGQYTADITPSSVTGNDVNEYDAPAEQEVHVTSDGQDIVFEYTENQDAAVTTNLTMPNAGTATSDIECEGTAGTYGPHAQASGSNPFDNMKAGSYTCTATSYTGTDTETYVPQLANPYSISVGTASIAITFVQKTPATQHVTTNIIAPNLPNGQTVAITLQDGTNTYGPKNQPAGNSTFDVVADASDYELTCAPYTVGSDTYECTPNDPYLIDNTHTELLITYSKVAPGGSYDWQDGHMNQIKNANVAAVIFGGGSTTGPVYIGSNPPANTKLVSTIEGYESSPLAIKSTAEIKLFPSYVAMGSVSQVSTDVTNQFKDQHLDIDNHYEGNGDANASCYFMQKNASGAVGGNQVDYFYLGNQTAGLQPLNWTTNPSVTNLVPAGTYVVSGDQFRATVTGGFQYYNAKIGTPIQVDATHITIPITFRAQAINTADSNPNLSDNGTVTFSVPTYISTNITYPAGLTPPLGYSEIDLAENMCGGAYYPWGGYTPQIDAIATQAAAVKATNGHTLIAGNVLYTTRFSDGGTQILDDITNPYNVSAAFFNLMYDAQRMEYQYNTNDVPMVMLLNPDSTWLFQNCTQYYCQLSWKPGITQDTNTILLANATMQSSIFIAIDKMVTEGYLTSGEATTLKSDFVSDGILTPTDGRTVPGIPEYMLAVNWVMHKFAPHIPFGQGNNVYDSTNPLLTPAFPDGKTAPYSTGSLTWIHKVNHIGYSSGQVASAITLQSQRYCQYMNDMNFWGKGGNYSQDFFYGDKYERDEIVNFIGAVDGLPHPQTTYVSGGYQFNGVDWDTTLAYYGGIATACGNKPLVLWQMPGSSLYNSTDTPPGVVGTFTAPIVSITRSGSTATVTTASAHGLTTGASIAIQYANQPEYNGNFTATVTGANTFTYPVTGTPATPATPAPGVNAIEASGFPGTEYWGSSTPTWIFGDAALKNDLTNLNTKLGIPAFLFTPAMNNSVYFTTNSKVSNNEDYLKLTSSAQITTWGKIKKFFGIGG